MKKSLAKQALNAIQRTRAAASRQRQETAHIVGQGLTVAGAAGAAFNDHKFGSDADPAKIAGIPTNLAGGLGVAAACAFFKIPGRKYVGPLALGVGCGGVYRGMMEYWETHK